MMAQVSFHEQNDSGIFPTQSNGNFQLWFTSGRSDISDMAKDLADLVSERLEALGINAFEAARRMGKKTDRHYVHDIINRKKRSVRSDKLPLLASALQMTPAELGTPGSPPPTNVFTVPIVGRVGDRVDGSVLPAEAGSAPPLPGSDRETVAVEVGAQLHDFAEEGSLLYFGYKSSCHDQEYLDHLVLVQLKNSPQPVVARLLRGSRPEHYDVAQWIGPKRRDEAVEWVYEYLGHLSAKQVERMPKPVTDPAKLS